MNKPNRSASSSTLRRPSVDIEKAKVLNTFDTTEVQIANMVCKISQLENQLTRSYTVEKQLRFKMIQWEEVHQKNDII